VLLDKLIMDLIYVVINHYIIYIINTIFFHTMYKMYVITKVCLT